MENKLIRKVIFALRTVILPKCHKREESHKYLYNAIISRHPLMVARFGAVEAKMLLYVVLPFPICKILRKYVYTHANTNAGFFPVNDHALRKFARRVIEDMQIVDVLAAWRPEEVFFKKQLRGCYRMMLGDLGPIDNIDSYTAALKDKRVLVIHPFAETIEQQYCKNRKGLFQHDEVLPEFASLETIKAVQTIAGNVGEFSSWFDALAWMEQQIDLHDYDVALIGCGAYGFPLAAHVKRMGKQAIHIGGPLQLYFGIKGQRWDNIGMYNEHWVRPDDTDRPNNFTLVENGCYW